MMRWLKDKKKDKRSNSSSQNEVEKEDDYGFGKEKSAAKSPSSRRQLPPTPATPEEMSPHIYEEIPDLPLCCMPDNEKALLQNKFGKSKHGVTAGTAAEAASVSLKAGASQKDDINPYMVVPVDKELRQTPTEFHRNGTPEVHCDVIVKETHCEILLSRKPKVGAFRLDNAVLSVGGENASERKNVRSNIHLSSHDKRAATDGYSGGNQSSAFSVTSSAFSSSSASKIQAGGTSSLSPVNSFEKMLPLEDASSSNAGENGVVTYSSASNFIPRSTKLVFNPLPGKNPCKEAFGSDSSDELHAVGYSSIKEDKKGVNSVSFISAREQNMGSQCVTYASIESNNDPDLSIDSHVTYASVQDHHYTDEKIKPSNNFDDILKTHQSIFLPNSLPDDADFSGGNKTGIIQPLSPSASSNCIYALVTFPAEPKHYNTISDIISPGFQKNINRGESSAVHSDESFCCETGQSAINTETSDMHSSDFSRISFHVNSTHHASSQASRLNFSKRICGDFSSNQFHHNPSTDNPTGQTKVANGESDISTKLNNQSSGHNLDSLESSSHAEHRLELEFCLCSDDHSSSCGCADAKHARDDDVASTVEGSGSCRSCGRLIRQITYSESYSDETYEHVYASRLLIRTGRRFSSPDITFSEVSNSEFQDVQNPHCLDFPYAVSRDDSWTSTRGSDIIPPSYNAAASCNILKSDNRPWIKKENSREASGHYAFRRDSIGLLHGHLCCIGDIQQSSSAGSKVTSAVHNLTDSSKQRDSAATSVKSSDFSFSNMMCDTLPTDQNRGHAELIIDSSPKHDIVVISEPVDSSQKHDMISTLQPVIDSSQKHDLAIIPEPKSSAFTGLLSRFSRTKSTKPAKPDSSEISLACASLSDKPQDIEIAKCDKSLEDIPEKNTRKLSKFFQRLNKEAHKSINDCVTLSETDNQASSCTPKETGSSNGKAVSFKAPCLENSASVSNSQKRWKDVDFSSVLNKGNDAKKESQNYNSSLLYKGNDAKKESQNCNSSLLNKGNDSKKESQNCNISTEGCEQVGLHAQVCYSQPHNSLSEAPAGLTETVSAVLQETTTILNVKSQCKTDSGDTCYEYDISTSSEGEQTGYEHFLSKVRKTLNLEHEVQHIAESSAARRKRVCKHCKKDELYSTINDEDEDNDELCPHFVAKFGDLRAIFEDMVVDQRAAILDCLTDFTYSPHNVRGHSHEGFCRECGCEISTSDSESQTTVCSLLSQQLFRMTSPSGQVLSCDSDEGTMADNSCESADEENGNQKGTPSKKSHYDDNSSGYDEPKDKQGHSSQKLRKREKKDKKFASSKGHDYSSKENGNHEMTSSLSFINILEDSHGSFNFSSLPAEPSGNKRTVDINETITSSIFSDSTGKNKWKKNTTGPQTSHSSRKTAGLYFSQGVDSFEGIADHSGACEISRSRGVFVTDKVLQDIYSPLPSKALSLLASKNYGPPVGQSCTCGKGPQASAATVTAHLVAGETETPPTGRIKPSPSGLVHCASDKNSGVVPVQKHLRNRKKTAEGEIFSFGENKDCDDPEIDRHTIGLQPENGLANNGYSLTGKNVETDDCLAPQTKPASPMSKKERSLVTGRDGNTVRNRSLAKERGHKSDCDVAKSSYEGAEKCSRVLPHTIAREESVDLMLTADNVGNKHSGLSCTSVVNDILSIDTKTDKRKYTRRHRLDLVALDLLQESAVDEDPTAGNNADLKSVQPKRSKVIDKIAKMFENNTGADNQSSGKNKQAIMKNLTGGKQNIIWGEVDKKDSFMHSSKHIPQTVIRDKVISDNAEIDTKKFVHVRHSARNVPDADLHSSQKRDNLYAMSQSSHLNFNESPPVGDIKDKRALKTRRSSSESRRDRDNEIKPTCPRSDNESGPLKTNELKAGRVKTANGKPSAAYLTESRQAQQKSPTPSTSSTSSSSSGKRKSGHAKHKVSKKSYSRKRSKTRTERAKNGHGKEERTYYYFSSDFSDIDVVEVNGESSNIFTATNLTHGTVLVGGGRKQSSNDKKPAELSENAVAASTHMQNKNVDAGECEQEVYALPSDSGNLRDRTGCMEKNSSCLQSPEIRHSKRTDVYKSRKSNNKLLSDLIIRNYDMQLYENV